MYNTYFIRWTISNDYGYFGLNSFQKSTFQTFKCINSHYIILERQNQLEIEKNDFLKILLIFNFCREMNKYAYIFSIFHFHFHGNHDFLFLAFFSNILG